MLAHTIPIDDEVSSAIVGLAVPADAALDPSECLAPARIDSQECKKPARLQATRPSMAGVLLFPLVPFSGEGTRGVCFARHINRQYTALDH